MVFGVPAGADVAREYPGRGVGVTFAGGSRRGRCSRRLILVGRTRLRRLSAAGGPLGPARAGVCGIDHRKHPLSQLESDDLGRLGSEAKDAQQKPLFFVVSGWSSGLEVARATPQTPSKRLCTKVRVGAWRVQSLGCPVALGARPIHATACVAGPPLAAARTAPRGASRDAPTARETADPSRAARIPGREVKSPQRAPTARQGPPALACRPAPLVQAVPRSDSCQLTWTRVRLSNRRPRSLLEHGETRAQPLQRLRGFRLFRGV
jgi:hypothetical protein